MKKKWVTKQKLEAKENREDEIVKILLANRGIKNEKDREKFFNTKDVESLDLVDIGIGKREFNKAFKRIKKALEKGEKVIIYGDYDADGITATAILWETLNKIGLDVMPFLPHREKQGYGLKKNGIDAVVEQYGKPDLIVTVDNGIVAFEGAEYCKELGIDLIISDHHEAIPGSNKYPENKSNKDEILLRQLTDQNDENLKDDTVIPDCIACIHSTETAGAGVSFLFAKKLLEEFGKVVTGRDLSLQINNLIEIATIGIIADLVKLLGVSRAIAKKGLAILPKTKRPGLKALFVESGIEKAEKFSSYHVGFVIGPRLNATGRLYHPIDSLRLLCTKNKARGQKLAIDLGDINKDRKEITSQNVGKVLRKVEQDGNNERIIISASHNYNPGIIGLIAGKITEKFYKPSIAIAIMGEFSKGSVRSVEGVNIIEFLRNFEKDFVDLGGHSMAAGFTVETKRLEEVKKKLEEFGKKMINKDLLVPTVKAETEIKLSDLSFSLFNKIEEFAPFGVGNERPKFISSDILVKSFSCVGKDKKHLKLYVAQENGESYDGIFFGGGEWESKLKPDQKIKLCYQIDINKWNGKRKIQLMVKDLEVSDTDQ